MALVASNISWPVEKLALGTIAFDSSYPTGGESISATAFGLSRFTRIEFEPTGAAAGGAGYVFNATIAADGLTANILVFRSAGFTPAGTLGTSSVTGTGTFTGTSPLGDLNLASPAFSGTGYATAGQVITTTGNQTMTLNQCAGMWFIADALASTAPVLIVSNTAVTGAPAVLTVIGTAPATDAGTYKIVKDLTPVGSVTALSGTAAAQTFTGTAVSAAALVEVANATNLAALTGVPVRAYGF